MFVSIRRLGANISLLIETQVLRYEETRAPPFARRVFELCRGQDEMRDSERISLNERLRDRRHELKVVL